MTPTLTQRLQTLAAEAEADAAALASGDLTPEEAIIRAERRELDRNNIRWYLLTTGEIEAAWIEFTSEVDELKGATNG